MKQTTRSVGEGVHELRLDFGPGYRIYYRLVNKTVVLLLGGEDRHSQSRDIRQAKHHWQEFQHHHTH
jgi:putative addiction module killer protein